MTAADDQTPTYGAEPESGQGATPHAGGPPGTSPPGPSQTGQSGWWNAPPPAPPPYPGQPASDPYPPGYDPYQAGYGVPQGHQGSDPYPPGYDPYQAGYGVPQGHQGSDPYPPGYDPYQPGYGQPAADHGPQPGYGQSQAGYGPAPGYGTSPWGYQQGAGGYDPYSYQPGAPYGTYGYGYGRPVRRTNGMAVASLVCSCAGILFFGVPAILAIVFGFVARGQIRQSRGTEGGDGLALAGIIVGCLVVAAWIVIVVLVAINANNCSNTYPYTC